MIAANRAPVMIFFLCLLAVSLFFIQANLQDKRQQALNLNYMDYTLPSKITGVAALEFKGIVSDFLFLKVSTFLGDKFLKKQKLEEKHIDYIYRSVDAITDIDPWFWDAYLFADMLLTWEFGKIDLANKLLEKAKQHRTWDFKVPYYLGFNHFYFLKDNAKGAQYIMEASRLPGSPSFFPSLASRLAMYQNQHGPAIAFLKDILKQPLDPGLQKQFKTRLDTLIVLESLEKAAGQFKKRFGHPPKHLQELVDKGLVDSIPEDPYGGRFILLKNGRIYTTSKMRYKKK